MNGLRMTDYPTPPDRPRRPTILIQTTIAAAVNDWAIDRFSQLVALLTSQRDQAGRPVFNVIARDRKPDGLPDGVLSTVDERDIDVLTRSRSSGEFRLPPDETKRFSKRVCWLS